MCEDTVYHSFFAEAGWKQVCYRGQLTRGAGFQERATEGWFRLRGNCVTRCIEFRNARYVAGIAVSMGAGR